MKTLIVFYSLRGHTRQLAEAMADEVGADLLELRLVKQPKLPGVLAFLWAGYSTMKNKTPTLQPLAVDPGDYDLLIIGSPVWGGSHSPALRTFCGQVDASGKKVALFASCGGSAGSTSDDLTKLLPGAEVVGQSIYAWGKGAVAEELSRSACDWAREVVSS